MKEKINKIIAIFSFTGTIGCILFYSINLLFELNIFTFKQFIGGVLSCGTLWVLAVLFGIYLLKKEEREMKGIKVDKKYLKNSQTNLYIKKPIPVIARQINQTFYVETKEGMMQGKKGDYLIRGIAGELYICDKEIFENSYDIQTKIHTKE